MSHSNEYLLVGVIVVSVLACIYFLISGIICRFKISYYEQTLKNNRGKFSEEMYAHIQKVMNSVTIFSIIKIMKEW